MSKIYSIYHIKTVKRELYTGLLVVISDRNGKTPDIPRQVMTQL